MFAPSLAAALAAALLVAAGPPAPAPEGDATVAPQAGAPAAPAPPTRRYTVEEIRLVGLQHTRATAVRRHLTVREGEALDDDAVQLSRLRLLQLGWFSAVETHVERGSERGWVVLVFTFTERNTLIVSDLVLGTTAPQPLYGGFGLSELNFLGLGLGLSGAFVYGGTPQQDPLAPPRFAVRGSFFDPDLVIGKLPLVAGISAIALHGEEFACSDADCAAYGGQYGSAPRLRYDRLGGELHVGIRPGPFERLMAGYRLEWVTSERVGGDARDPGTAGPYVRPGHSLVSALSASYERDTRNDLFFPTDGSRLFVSAAVGSQAIGGDYEYGRFLVQLESDHGLPNGHAIRLLGAAGLVQGDAPFFERFYAADWAYFSVGPALGRALELNFSTDSRYDAVLAALGAEYGIPLWSSGAFFSRGYLALGARWVYTGATASSGRTAVSRTPFSGDVALRLDTPIGSFNLSLAYALDNFL